MDGYGTACDAPRLLQNRVFWCKIESKIILRHQDAGFCNKPGTKQSELTDQGIDELHTPSRGIVGKKDIRSRATDTVADELASNRAEGANIQAPCLAHCGHNTSRHGVLPAYTDESCVDCVCSAWDPPLEAYAIKGRRKKPFGKPCILSLALPLSPPVVVPLIKPQEHTPLVVVVFLVNMSLAPLLLTMELIECSVIFVKSGCKPLVII